MLLDTPFGKATSKKVLTRNITKYIVDGKDYIYVGGAVNDTIPEEFSSTDGWYTATTARILHLIYPQIFPPKEVSISSVYYMHNHPDIYEYLRSTQFNTLIVMPTKFTSVEAHRRRWYDQNKLEFIEIAAWSDNEENVDPGFVLIEAAIGGDSNNYTSFFLVPEQEYNTGKGEYGFVCNPAVHEERETVE